MTTPPPARSGPVRRGRLGPFWGSLLFLVSFYLALRVLYPIFGGWLASRDWFSLVSGLESTGHEIPLYFSLAIVGVLCFVSYQEERWQRFQEPLWRFFQWRSPVRAVVLVAVPVLGGAAVLLSGAGAVAEPQSNPIKHPTPPDVYGSLRNPYRHPTEEMLLAFEEAVKGGSMEAEATTEPAVQRYVEALQAGGATPEQREAAFRRRTIEEGRILFQTNCRPCHGTKARGDGPLARGLRRQPADFTGVETIATLVEGAVFWRIKKGGIGLPSQGSPWESAMPAWETDLEDDQIWKIIMAEYDIAGNRPREPEREE